MNWYRKSMALEPGTYKTDPNPHRQQRHQEKLKTPMGLIYQKQNPDQIDSDYGGVHLTDSIEMAGVYANNKSTIDDPPVIIELYKEGLQGIPDIDAKSESVTFSDFMMENKVTFESVVNDDTLTSQEKVEDIVEMLEQCIDFSDGSEVEDPVDSISAQSVNTTERALLYYLQSFSDPDQSLLALHSLINGEIPDKILIFLVNQFRVMSPIGSEKVHSIYKMERVNLEEFRDWEHLNMMDEEELEDAGITKVGDQFLDDEGRHFVGYEDTDYGHWLVTELIYQDPTQNVSSDYTYHGTTLSRAKSAYPELLP